MVALENKVGSHEHSNQLNRYRNVLESAILQIRILPDVDLMIKNYIDVVRRDIVEDHQLIDICNKIYNTGIRHGLSQHQIYYMWEVRRITSCAVWESGPSEVWQGQRKLFL